MSSVAAPVPVTVLAGYLGAGKTTLLNRLIRVGEGDQQSRRRIGVLVNDFGEINIDAALIENRDGHTIGLTNGCVCCSVADDLGAGLDAMASLVPPVEHLYIEASGVADPSRIAAYARTWPGFTLAAVVVLVDAERIRAQAADRYIGGTVSRTLKAADRIAVTRAAAFSRELAGWLAEQAPGTPIVALHVGAGLGALRLAQGPTSVSTEPESQRDVLTLPGIVAGQRDMAAPHAEHESLSWVPAAAVDLGALQDVLAQLPAQVVRGKGWVQGLDGAYYLVQGVPGCWTLAENEAHQVPATGLVFVLRGDADAVRAASQALRTRLERVHHSLPADS